LLSHLNETGKSLAMASSSLGLGLGLEGVVLEHIPVDV